MSRQTQLAPRLPQPAAQLRQCSAAGLLGLLALVALLVAWRRLAGALSSPLGPAAMVLVGASLAGVAAVARCGRRPVRWHLLLSAAVLLLALALWLPGSPRAGLLLFWAILAGEEGWAWAGLLLRRRRPQPASPAVPRWRVDPAQSLLLPSPPDVARGADLPGEKAQEDAVPAENVLQKLTLSQDADGSQRLSGWVRLRLEAGQRSGVVHVAFCPPFAQTPEWSLEQLDGPPARIRTAQLLPHGVRLDLKLAAAAADAASVLVRFTAWTAEEGLRT